MYPLNMSKDDGRSFAVANSQDEHEALTEHGYGPPFRREPASEIDAVRVRLDELGIAYDKRFGIDRLKALLPESQP